MTAKINTILEINNTLNGIVNKRKETQAQIVNYTNQIIDLEKQLANTKSANTATLEIENKIGALQTLVQACHVNNTNNVYDIDSLTTTEQNEKFDNLVKAFTSGVEIINAKDNSKIAVALQDQEYIKCVHQGLAITTANNNKIIIYPNITLAQNANNNFYIVPTSDFKFTFYTKPEATKQASQDVNQVKENEIGVFIDAIYDEKFLVQDGAKYLTLQEAIDNYLTLLKTIEGPALVGIKKTYFENIVVFGNDFSAFLNTLKTDITFTNIVLQSPAFKDILNANESKAIESMALIDLLQCFTNLAEISNENSNETFSLLYLIAKQQGIQITQYQDVPNLNSADVKAYCKQLIAVAQTQLQKSATQNNFVLAQLLKSYNPAFYTQYISHLYKYASIVIKADGKVTRPEEDGLKKLFESNNGEENFKPTQIQNTTNPEKTLEQLIYELYDLTGLQPVKAEINNLISLIKIKKAREEFELTNTKMSLHLVFTGSPGTGKTTVARFVAQIYKCLGVLQKGHLVETDRSGMIAEYTGQTAIKVNKLVDSALHGVLFIDEAYAILTDAQDAYGKEAIATLLKRMEDDRDKLIVILAGYTTEMEMFIDSNPGLKSRFNKYIHFSNYTADELYSIFISMSRKLHFTCSLQVVDAIRNHFAAVIEKGDDNFGNGRYVRNFFEKLIEKQANRLASDTNLNKEKLTTFLMEDIPEVL